jgi:uncharacterized membrane protein
MDQMLVVLTFAVAIGSGVMGGFFFAFSVVVMAALARRPAAEGMAAMQAVNVLVLNPLFFAFFFGTGAICLVLAAMAVAGSSPFNGLLVVIASLAYLLGGIGITMARHVPLNNALAVADPQSPAGAALWTRYLVSWAQWNHLRTVACIVAAVAFTLCLYR